jgi:hypothetical protein
VKAAAPNFSFSCSGSLPLWSRTLLKSAPKAVSICRRIGDGKPDPLELAEVRRASSSVATGPPSGPTWRCPSRWAARPRTAFVRPGLWPGCKGGAGGPVVAERRRARTSPAIASASRS